MKNLLKAALFIGSAVVIGILLAQTAQAQVTFPNRGGTGTATPPTIGQVLVGCQNAQGQYVYCPQATSTLGFGVLDTSGFLSLAAWYATTTDSLDEGLTNLYHTVARARAAITEAITGIGYSSSTGAFSLDAGYVVPTSTRLADHDTAFGWGNHATQSYFDKDTDDTGDLTESGNLFFTTARVLTYLDTLAKGYFFSTTSADKWETAQTARTADDLTNNPLSDLSDVGALSPSTGHVLVYSGGSWGSAATGTLGFPGGTVTSVGVSGANGIGVSGSPVTTNGSISLSLGTITGATWNGSTIGVAYGGTGSSTLSGILKGNGISAVQTAVPGADYVATTTGDWLGTLDGFEGSAFERDLTAGDGLTRTADDFDCDIASGSVLGCLSSTHWALFNQKVSSTSLSAAYPLAYNSGTGAFSWIGLSTSSALTASQVVYATGVGTIASVATGTVSGTNGVTATAGRSVLGGSLAIDCTAATAAATGCLQSNDWTLFNSKVGSTSLSASYPLAYNSTTGAFTFNGLGTSSTWAAGNLAFVVSGNSLSSVATGTLSESVPGLELDATRSLIGGSATLSLSSGFEVPLSASTTEWNTAFLNRITSLGGQTGASQTFASSTSGTDFRINSAADVHTFTLPSASASARGLLTGADWSTFNGKQDVFTAGDGLTLTGTDIDCDTATASALGCLASADFTVFNNKISSTSIDTVGELQNLTGGGNLILETEMDTGPELAALLDDETGTGVVVFNTAATLASTTLTGSTTMQNATSATFAVTGAFNLLGDAITNVGTWIDAKVEALTSVTLQGVWDFSSATVRQHVYPSISWPGGPSMATTTTSTTTLTLGDAAVSETWNAARCKSIAVNSVGFRFTDGTNHMNFGLSTTSSATTTLSSNNSFTGGEARYMQIGPMTNGYIDCTFDITR